MEPIRVLQVFGKMNRAGAETFIMNVYRNIDRRRVQFDFLVYNEEIGDYEEEIKELGGNIYRVASIHPRTYYRFKKELKCFLQKSNYKMIHSHIDALSVFPLAEAKKVNIPIRIAHSHTSNVKMNIKSIAKYILKNFITKYSTHQFACSKKSMKWMFGETISQKENSKVINNGVDTNKFTFKQSKRKEIRQTLDIEGKFVIGSVGKFIKTKNHTFLVDIFNEVYKKNSEAILLLIGTGGLENKVKEKVDHLGLINNVIFLGVRDNVEEFMQAMDVFVMPSLYEGFPVTLVEAQAAGLPCIVSDTITQEVKITPLVDFISLNSMPQEWGEKILDTRNIERSKMDSKILEKGFSIVDVSKSLEKFYLEKYNNL